MSAGAIMSDYDVSKHELLANALKHMRTAIEMLDLAAAPGHLAAHVDLAASQLEELLTRKASPALKRVNENGDGCEKVSPF